MDNLFLYRLFKYSKTGFILVIVFIIFFSVFFYKKMDSVFFPYNSMFSIDFNKNNTAVAYAVKFNGRKISISDNLYWKKDFMEESLYNYAQYKKADDSLFMDGYINSKLKNNSVKKFLLARLVPDKSSADHWLSWYIRFSGCTIPAGTTIELMEYSFVFENDAASIKDSASIYKTNFINAE